MWRFCVDSHRPNSLSKADTNPMSRAKHINALDITKGYWQVPVEKSARHKTALAIHFGF